ncbi:N-acetylmuramoyl-L-alanine amidase [Ekhidna lutea]|uniref:N-acetylmuramoyl-L-alanine amidase n=1 Tax=Ekhidna lutea TaxID=447679 RepID=A0A239JFH5_EKHLU|nr:N-acetylmuramoyl-L-alanine amidase [Ekhidna lutea]SNT04043.1 N-acetylmuramoyl-L-alanine amidase [Ekhidna lutea]
MNEVLIYVAKVIVIQAIFFAFYRLVLRKTARHMYNRVFLLVSLLSSFLIPFMKAPVNVPVEDWHSDEVFLWVQESVNTFELIPAATVTEEVNVSFWDISPWIYGAIALFLIGRSFMYLILLQKLKKHSEYVKKQWFKLFKTTQPRPFSFFSNVFIPGKLFGGRAFDQVLAHECVHVKQRHSIDRLLLDFLVSLFWFNPFIYWYRNALIEIHEYQADEAVIQKFRDPIGYQEILFDQLQNASYSGLVSHFNFSLIKKRIVMMNKQKTKYSSWKYALGLPLLATVIFAFSTKEAIKPIEKVGNELGQMMKPDALLDLPIFNVPEVDQDAYTPSILPLKQTDKVKMTSGFGKRMHPIHKVEKMHKGMDFSCPMGTEVIAPADGVVKKQEAKTDGYGNLMILDHGGAYQTRYGQLSEFKLKEGDRVKKGDVIALSGNSGTSTAPHLHYEVLKDGEHVNPMFYIKDFNFKASSTGASVYEASESEELLAEREMMQAERELRLAEMEMQRAEKEAYKTEMLQEKAEMLKEKELAAMHKANLLAEKEKLKKEKEKFKAEKEKAAKEKNKQEKKSKIKRKNGSQAFRVIIDPGHGGKDAGATSPSGVSEAALSLAIGKRVRDLLNNNRQVEVILTRESDEFLSLESRVERTENADLYISLHTDNYAGEGSFIMSTFFEGNEFTERSNEIANFLASEFESCGKEAKVAYSYEHYVLKNAKCPAVLLHYGFFSDPSEDEHLSSEDGQLEVAQQVVDAIKLAAI